MTFAPLLIVAWLAQIAAPASAVTIHGRVVDGAGAGLEGVLVSTGTPTVRAVSDGHGEFVLVLAAGSACPCVVTAALPGHGQAHETTTGDTPLTIALGTNRPMFRATTTVASTLGTDPSAASRLSVSPLEVVRTAGTQADIMRDLATMPGVTTVDGGTGLFVRGGDVSEVQVLFDGVVVSHPYRDETPTGGFRGAVDPFMTKDTTFTTGGFGSPYGNALSAVVDFTPQDRPIVRQMTETAGLAGVSWSLAQPVGSASGLRVALNRSTPSLLFAVNSTSVPFDQYPGGWQGSGAWYLNSKSAGDLRVFVLHEADHVGVQVQRDAFTGFLHASTSHSFMALHWQKALSAIWHVSASAGGDDYTSGNDVGVLAISTVDHNQSARTDLTGAVGAWAIHLGQTADIDRPREIGQVPFAGGDFSGTAGVKSFDVTGRTWTTGSFVDLTRTFGRLTSEVGLRADFFSGSATWTADPRLSLVFALNKHQRLRFAAGEYHQAPSAAYLDRSSGNPQLAPMRARHLIVGYEYGAPTGPTFVRIEAYDKPYASLPLADATGIAYSSTGYGYARGLDAFLTHTWPRLTLRTNASWLVAERRWTPFDQQNTYPVPLSGTWPPDFDIPYAFEAVSTIKLPRRLSLDVAWRTTAGRPDTPAVGAVLTPNGYEPIWGALNSDRLPAYARLDLSISRDTVVARRPATVFVTAGNVLDRRNSSTYVYADDFSSRTAVPSGSPRNIYLGITIR